MRLFVAIDIPAAVRSALESFQRMLKPTAKLSWTPVANLHVTTKFIGEWPEARLDEMKNALARIPAPGSFEIHVKGTGWFPHARRPHVFWAGIEGGEPLRALARDTEQAATALGVPVEDRAYSPHLTLAHIREAVPLLTMQEKLQAHSPAGEFDFGSFRASRFFLYLSRGGQYTQLAGFPLE